MKSKCKTCGKNCEGDYCFSHKPYKKMRSATFRSTNPTRDVDKSHEMRIFFFMIWEERTHKSEVSGEYLGKGPSSGYFHHILPKSKYPDLAYKDDNIILLTLDEHANVESNIYKYEEINNRRTLLKEKYL